VVAATCVLLVGCAVSPTTTYRDASGATVTVDWADYPAQAWTAAEDILAGPSVEETPARERSIVADVAQAVSAEFGTGSPVLHGEGAWYPSSGNGYGGQSMLVTFNSGEWRIDATIPPEHWERVLDAIAAALAPWGLVPQVPVDPEDEITRSTTMWFVDFIADGPEWLAVTVGDARLDAAEERIATANGWLVAGVTLSYGITTISESDRETFRDRSAPFAGLTRPAETHSD